MKTPVVWLSTREAAGGCRLCERAAAARMPKWLPGHCRRLLYHEQGAWDPVHTRLLQLSCSSIQMGIEGHSAFSFLSSGAPLQQSAPLELMWSREGILYILIGPHQGRMGTLGRPLS